MIRALWSASSGMVAQQMNMDNIANNLANINTTGYKKSKVEFQDLVYAEMRAPGTRNLRGAAVPTGFQVGHGVMPAANKAVFEQGPLQETGNPLDLAINGNGFFGVQMPDGETGYTRDGAFRFDGAGQLVNNSGYLVLSADGQPIKVNDTTAAAINRGGEVLENDQVVGRIGIFSFNNPAELNRAGNNLYTDTDNSGAAGEADAGGYTILTGALETANVHIAEEMTTMMIAQRGYELNSRAIRTADEMLGQANALLRR